MPQIVPTIEEYVATMRKEDATPKSNKAVLWMLPYEDAVKFYEERVKVIDSEFGEDE